MFRFSAVTGLLVAIAVPSFCAHVRDEIPISPWAVKDVVSTSGDGCPDKYWVSAVHQEGDVIEEKLDGEGIWAGQTSVQLGLPDLGLDVVYTQASAATKVCNIELEVEIPAGQRFRLAQAKHSRTAHSYPDYREAWEWRASMDVRLGNNATNFQSATYKTLGRDSYDSVVGTFTPESSWSECSPQAQRLTVSVRNRWELALGNVAGLSFADRNNARAWIVSRVSQPVKSEIWFSWLPC